MRTPTGVTVAQYQQAVSEDKPTHIRLTFPVQNIILDDSNITMEGGLTLSTIANPDSDLTMGYALANVLDVEFFNSAVFTGFDWTEEFKFEAGIEINGTTNWITIGWFKGQRPEKTLRTQTINFTAYDKMINFDRLADDWIDSLTFPMTMEAMFRSLCTYVGVGYASTPANQISAAMNISYSVNPLFKGISCRTVLSWIAEANGCYAIYRAENNGTGVIDLRFVNDYTSSMTIPENDCFEIDLEDYTIHQIDYVHFASSDEEVPGFVYPLNKTYKYEILDNPLLLLAGTSEKQNVINGILSHFAVMGNYRPMRIVAVGNWLMEVGDMVKVSLADGTEYNLIGINKTIQWNGGCVCEYECPGNIERLEMNQSKKEKYELGGKLSDKYTIVSGVDITDDGVDITGNKHVKIYSGGILLVQATDFKIDSDNKRIYCGNYDFSNYGLSYKFMDSGSPYYFIIGPDTSPYLDPQPGAYNTMRLYAGYNSIFGNTLSFSVVNGSGVSFCGTTALTGSTFGLSILSNRSVKGIGTDGSPWDYGFFKNVFTQNIKYKGYYSTSNLIRFLNNTVDQYGNGIAIGDGGVVVIGAGESAQQIIDYAGISAGTETLYLASDFGIKLLSNVNNGYSSRKEAEFDTSGNFTIPGRFYQNGTAVPLSDTNTWRGYQIKNYYVQYTVGANTFKDITASNFGASNPTGYTPVAVCMFNPGNDKCWASAIKADATGSTPMMTVHNPTGGSFTNHAYISILYLQTGNP